MTTDTPTPERVTLTGEERQSLGDMLAEWHKSACDGECIVPVVEGILAAREQALREEVAGDAALSALESKESPESVVAMLMDAADRMDNPQHKGNQHRWPEHAQMFRNLAARIARGGAR